MPVDPVRAYVWFSLSADAATGVEARLAAANRDAAAALLSPAKRAEAQDLARICIQSQLKICD
ncbi:MAG: hypothetical protein EBT83_17975 [Betaproteobacteria bacterium]|nr:hypothetical protein [Betaproteobacteria bacterium]